MITLSGFYCITWFEVKHDASVNSLKAMDIVSQDEPSFTDQFMELLPNLIIEFAISIFFKTSPGANLINLLGAHLGASLSQVNRVRRLNKCLKVL